MPAGAFRYSGSGERPEGGRHPGVGGPPRQGTCRLGAEAPRAERRSRAAAGRPCIETERAGQGGAQAAYGAGLRKGLDCILCRGLLYLLHMKRNIQGNSAVIWKYMCLLGGLLLCALLGACTPGHTEKQAAGMPETASPLPAQTPTATPAPTALPTLPVTPAPTPYGLLSWREGKLFSTGDPQVEEDGYFSETLRITLHRVQETKNAYSGRTIAYFLADIYIKDITSLRRGYSKQGTFQKGGTQFIEKIARAYGAILTVSGDYSNPNKSGLVFTDGVLEYESRPYKRDLCVLYKDGTMEMYSPGEIDKEAILAKDPWQSWNFGPILLDENGDPAESFNLPDAIAGRNPRTVIGYYSPGHYCLLVVDGRQQGYSLGLSMKELAAFMADLGCKAAYNLDGGISAQIAYMGERINHPGKDRNLRDVILLLEPESTPTPAE